MARKKAQTATAGGLVGTQPDRRALYLRVSTEDQAERGTIRAQLDYLRQKVELENRGREMQGLPPVIIAGEYADDGISGTVPVADRPQGQRLLEDARAGLFSSVLVYRLDRLGRRMRVLLEAHDALDAAGVAIVSATEPFDTSTPFGRAMFGFLGVMAELEKSTIADRMNSGRDTAVRGGKWTNGVIPFGYTVDDKGCLLPSDVMVPGTGMTESEIARAIFERLAGGGSAMGICRWLNALGVPTASRFTTGKVWALQADEWKPARVHHMVRRTLYTGSHTFRSRLGPVTRDVPPLVTQEMQQRAIAVMAGNAHLPSRAKRHNLLTGILRCDTCGGAYVGWTRSEGQFYYRCTGQTANTSVDPAGRCRSKIIRAELVEDAILAYVRRVCTNPGEILAEAQAALRNRSGLVADTTARREALTGRLVDLDAERERMLTLYKRGRISLEDAESTLEETAQATGAIRSELDALRSQEALASAAETRLVDAATILHQLGEGFDALTREQQAAAARRIVLEAVVVTTELSEKTGRNWKGARLELHVVCGSPQMVGLTDIGLTDSKNQGTDLAFVHVLALPL